MIIEWVTGLLSLRGKYFPFCLEQQKEEKKVWWLFQICLPREIKPELWGIFHKAKSSIKLTSLKKKLSGKLKWIWTGCPDGCLGAPARLPQNVLLLHPHPGETWVYPLELPHLPVVLSPLQGHPVLIADVLRDPPRLCHFQQPSSSPAVTDVLWGLQRQYFYFIFLYFGIRFLGWTNIYATFNHLQIPRW